VTEKAASIKLARVGSSRRCNVRTPCPRNLFLTYERAVGGFLTTWSSYTTWKHI